MQLVRTLRGLGFVKYDGKARIGSCIYVLAYRSRVQYVGRTTALYERLAVHRSRRPWKYDACYFVPVPRGRLPLAERALNKLLRPEHNNLFTDVRMTAPETEILEWLRRSTSTF